MSAGETALWHLLAGLTIGLGLWYIHWRWSASLNPDAMAFSVTVAAAETALFLGTLLFFYDIWREGDTEPKPPPENRVEAGLEGDGPIRIDILVTTFDEGLEILRATIADAQAIAVPPGCETSVHILDDGNQAGMSELAEDLGVNYMSRPDNAGFKAGNLHAALMRTRGDFFVICDADTRLFPRFLMNTLGYFRDRKVSWVQTPHWFYDLPEGTSWPNWTERVFGRNAAPLARGLALLTGKERVGADPFKSDASVFFDVIQRRRNRHGASFCCGAGSVHRREAVFGSALSHWSRRAGKLTVSARFSGRVTALKASIFQPFRYHVSEDILTSIDHHAHGWISVYHPQVEARMLSPWSVAAWSAQKLKYAGGTFDIMLRANPVVMSGMDWRIRLHYAATFWSYLSIVWLPILLMAPIVALFTGISPVDAYSAEFFWHIVPLLLVNEMAMIVGCKGYDTHSGRLAAVSSLAIQMRAAWQVVRGHRPRFPTTPKKPGQKRDLSRAKPAFVVLFASAAAAVWGIYSAATGVPGYSVSLLVVNIFWMTWNARAFVSLLSMSLWEPALAIQGQPMKRSKMTGDPHVQSI